jgi:hypothetical protein
MSDRKMASIFDWALILGFDVKCNASDRHI